MTKKIFTIFIALFIIKTIKAQNAIFVTLDDAGNLYRVNTSTCTSTPLNLCNNFTGNPLSIALDGNLLYIVDNQGYLYKSTLTNTGTANSCTKIGKFPTLTASSTVIVTDYFGLTVGNGGVVYASNGNVIQTYTPSTNTFAKLPGAMLGTANTDWLTGGDLLFYQGVLYNAVKIVNSGGTTIGNALIKINLTNVSNSTLYMNFNAGTSVFGFASVTVPCANNQAYALSSNTSTTDIFPVDMITKTQSTIKTCTLPYKVYDAASIAETQSATPPSVPTVVSPVNFCIGQTPTALSATVTSTNDTLRWYKQAVGGTSYGVPTPAVSTSTIGTTNYYVSAFDTSTGCESARDTIKVIVNPYPAIPTITPSGNDTICTGSTATLTSSATTGNQWFFNGSAITGANNKTYNASNNGDYTVTVTGVGGCSKTSAPTTIYVLNPSISYTGSPFCNAGTTAVSLTGATNGVFSATSGLSINNTTGTIDLNASTLGNYTITFTTIPANCICSTTVSVVHPTATIAYGANAFCKKSSTQNIILTTTGNATGGTYSSTPSGLTIDANGTITPATSTPNDYTITYTFGTAGIGCGIQTTSTKVTILPDITKTVDTSICNGTTLAFNGNTYNTSGTYVGTFTSAAGCDSVVTLKLTVLAKPTSTTSKTICKGDTYLFNGNSYTTAGTYNSTVSTSTGCDSVATLVLTIEDFKITLSQNPNPVYAGANFTAQITGNTTIVSSVWQPVGLFTNNQPLQNATAPNSSFQINVNATSSNGCKANATADVVVVSKNSLYIPNALDPSHTGNIDISTLKVYGNGIQTAEMTVYNQWGEKVFTTTNANIKGWDGTMRGKLQPIGVYIYVVKVTYIDGEIIHKKGMVNLIR